MSAKIITSNMLPRMGFVLLALLLSAHGEVLTSPPPPEGPAPLPTGPSLPSEPDAPDTAFPPGAPLITIGGHSTNGDDGPTFTGGDTYAANSLGAYVIESRTLSRGSQIIESGYTISLAPSGRNIVVNGHTSRIRQGGGGAPGQFLLPEFAPVTTMDESGGQQQVTTPASTHHRPSTGEPNSTEDESDTTSTDEGGGETLSTTSSDEAAGATSDTTSGAEAVTATQSSSPDASTASIASAAAIPSAVAGSSASSTSVSAASIRVSTGWSMAMGTLGILSLMILTLVL